MKDSALETHAPIRRWIDLAPWPRRVFLLAILLLGAGVFLWGTAYKMSLYQGSPIHNKVPEAKLLTQASSATTKDKVASVTMPRTLKAVSLLLNLALLVFVLSQCLGSWLAELAYKPVRRISLAFPPAFFLRPPPSPLRG